MGNDERQGPWKVLSLEKQVEILKELSACKAKGENLGRDLRRLQHRVQIILNNWMDFYRVAVGNYAHETQPVPKMSFASSNRNQPGSQVEVKERARKSRKKKSHYRLILQTRHY